FMGEIRSAFRRTALVVVGTGSSPTSNQLSGYMPSQSCIREGIHHFPNSCGEFPKPIRKFVGGHINLQFAMLNEQFAMIGPSDGLTQESSIHANIGTRDETTRLRAGQKNCRAYQFMRLAKPVHRRVRPDGFCAVTRGAVVFEKQFAILLRREKAGCNG